MYQLASLSPQELVALQNIKIKNQSQIKEAFGQPLVLTRVYQLIKEESDDFTKENKLALEADQLLFSLMNRDKLPTTSKEKNKEQKLDKVALLTKKIKGFQIAARLAKGDQKEQLEKKVKGFEIALRLANRSQQRA